MLLARQPTIRSSLVEKYCSSNTQIFTLGDLAPKLRKVQRLNKNLEVVLVVVVVVLAVN